MMQKRQGGIDHSRRSKAFSRATRMAIKRDFRRHHADLIERLRLLYLGQDPSGPPLPPCDFSRRERIPRN